MMQKNRQIHPKAKVNNFWFSIWSLHRTLTIIKCAGSVFKLKLTRNNKNLTYLFHQFYGTYCSTFNLFCSAFLKVPDCCIAIQSLLKNPLGMLSWYGVLCISECLESVFAFNLLLLLKQHWTINPYISRWRSVKNACLPQKNIS